jgi:hypothetical protein
MSTSLKRIEANRLNARLSTGPRSANGKAVVARNAQKHGIFSNEVVIAFGAGREDRSLYDAMLAGLVEDLRPEGQIELLLVEKIAVDHWRLKRVIRFETAGVMRSVDYTLDGMIRQHHGKSPRPEMKYRSYGDPVTAEDVAHQERRVQEVSDPAWYPDDEALEPIFRRATGRDGDDPLPDDWRERARHAFESLTEPERTELQRQIAGRERQILEEMKEVRRLAPELEEVVRAGGFPDLMLTEKVMKYEAALERSIYRNLDLLFRLQHARRERGDSPEGEAGYETDIVGHAGGENGFVLE